MPLESPRIKIAMEANAATGKDKWLAAESPMADSKALSLQLSAVELERLNAAAKRHGLTVNALVRDVLSGFLKYQG